MSNAEMERDVRWNCMIFPKEQCSSLTRFTTVLIVLVVLSISSGAFDFTYSREWSPSSISTLAEMNCFVLNIQVFSASRCSTFCIENEEICLAFMFNVFNHECFICRSSITDGQKFNSVYSQDIFAYKIDLCPEGYDLVRSGQCLKGFHDQVNRDSAKSQCESLGARLISIRTQYQEDAVFDYVRLIAGGNKFWTDLKKVSGLWYHDGGILPTYDWTANAAISGDGVCVAILYDGDRTLYNDLDCIVQFRSYMCEYVAV